jgi:hypothetical protein
VTRCPYEAVGVKFFGRGLISMQEWTDRVQCSRLGFRVSGEGFQV